MYKLVTFAGYDHHGPHIFPIEPDVTRSLEHIKMARPLPPRIEQYIKTAKPIPGKTQLLIDAMGAGEYYGCNVNADYFPEVALRHEGADYGYQTFMHYAYPFKHHVNKDPARAYGDKVTLADYDPHMHRVLLIVTISDEKCRDILSDLANNRYWDVSMGCFRAGTRVTVENGITKPIEEIVVGDKVLTHRGRYRAVTEIHRRLYKGDMHAIKAAGRPTVNSTSAHPFYAVNEEQVRTNPGTNSRAWIENAKVSPDWIHAECLQGQILLEPIAERVLGECPSLEYARLLGYYLADGFPTRDKKRRINGLSFSVSNQNPLLEEVESIATALQLPNAPVYSPHETSDEASFCSIYGKDIAEQIYKDGLSHALTKRLSKAVLGWSDEHLLAMLGAFANGDGCALENDALRLSTCSRDLADQFRMILHWLGIPASMAILQHKAGKGFTPDRGTIEYAIHIGKLNIARFAQWTYKASDVQPRKIRRDRIYVTGPEGETYCISPIREISALPVEMEVFNLEVEEDESYLAEGLAVHNCRVPWDECSICKNRAKNRGEYCTHLRYQMNKILQDGRRVCAYNWLPKFFDISFVTIGAEKASHVLKKVAMQGGAGVVSSVELGESYYAKLADEEKKAIQRKEADIDKDVPSQPPADVRGATPEDKAKIDDFMNDAGDVKADERSMAPETLNNLAGFPLDQVFSTLAALGISLRPEEFQRIILVKQGAIKLADQLERHRLVFDETERGPVPGWTASFGRYSDDAVNEKVAMYLRPYVADRSCYPEILLARLESLEKRADFEGYNRDSQWYPMSKDEKRRNSGIPGIIPASMALAAGFMVFKKAFPGLVMKGPAPVRALAQNPWLLPMLIGAGVGASVGLSHMTAPRPLGQYGTGSGLDGKTASAYDAKTASVAGAAGRLGLIPAAYMYSGIQQRRWKRGERLNAIDRFFATRPDAAAIALFGVSPRLAKGAKNLVKKGGVMGDMALYTVGNTSKLMPAVLAGAALDSAIFQAIRRIAARKKETNRAHSR